MERLGIECLSTFALPPADHVRLAADLGCGHVSLNPGGAANPLPPHGKVPWRGDAAAQRAVAAALRETGVALSLVEGFAILPDTGTEVHLPALDLAAGLGGGAFCAVSLYWDMGRTHG